MYLRSSVMRTSKPLCVLNAESYLTELFLLYGAVLIRLLEHSLVLITHGTRNVLKR